MPILFSVDDAIATITISRPDRRNAWKDEFHQELDRCFERVANDDAIRVAILTGDEAGSAFCAGADLQNPETHRSRAAEAFVKDLPRLEKLAFNLPAACPKPVVCAVNGHAVGIGCSLTYACDLIVASERAQWRLAQVELGLVPKYGSTVRLARWVGQGMAMRMAMGFPMNAEEAFRSGLAQWLVPHADLMAKAREVAGTIAGYPPLSPRMIKDSLLRGQDIANLADAAVVDQYRFMVLDQTDDVRERHEAWRAKRKRKASDNGS